MPAKRKTRGFFKATALAVTAVVCLGTAPSTDTKETHSFRLSIRGFPAGTITIAVAKSDKRYALAGSLRPNAFLRAIRDVGYKGKASGSYKGIRYQPSNYQGNTKTGSRNSTVKIRFKNGKPIVDSYLPMRARRPYDINPSAQRGTIDLLTSAYLVFGDSPAETLCNRTIPMFDGRRRTKLTLAKPTKSASGATCKGTYTRIAGFPAHDLQERVNFPFTLVYDRKDDGSYRLMSFRTETTYGTAKASRK